MTVKDNFNIGEHCVMFSNDGTVLYDGIFDENNPYSDNKVAYCGWTEIYDNDELKAESLSVTLEE